MRVLLFIICLALVACDKQQTEFETLADMEAFISDPKNGFIKSFETEEFIFETKLTPALASDTTGHFSLAMRINRKDGGSVLDYGVVGQQEALLREGYLSFEVLGDVSVECDGELYPALFHHYERNYGLKPSVDLFFDFPEIKPKGPVYFIYRDQLFGQGQVKIEMNNELFTACYVKKA